MQITNASSLDDIKGIYLQINSAIKSFCIYVKEKVIGNQDNPITDAIIIELRKEVFIEEFDQSNKEIEYFRRVDLASKIALNLDFENIFKQFITREGTMIPYICLLMMKNEQSKAKLFEVINAMDLNQKNNILKLILSSDINFDDIKELIENENFYRYFEYHLINSNYLESSNNFNQNQIIKFLFEKNKFELIIQLLKLNKIQVDAIIKQFNLLDDSYKEIFLKEDIQDQCIIIANLSYEKKIDQSFLKRIFSAYSKEDLEKILKKIIPNSGEDFTKLQGLLFIKELVKNNLIDESLLFSTIASCSPENKKLIALYSINKEDESFKKIVKYLLENKLIDEASIFEIPWVENFDKAVFFLNLNNMVSSYRMQDCQSLMQYLIKTKNYKMLYYFLKNSKIQTSSEEINFDELVNDVSGSLEGINSLLLLFKSHRDQINFENLTIYNAKKLASYFMNVHDVDGLSILLAKKEIANDEEIFRGITLLNYGYSTLNFEVVNFLRNRNSYIASEAESSIMEAQAQGSAGSAMEENQFDRIIAQYRIINPSGITPRINFLNITDQQIKDLNHTAELFLIQ